jgi:hypothetical protein
MGGSGLQGKATDYNGGAAREQVGRGLLCCGSGLSRFPAPCSLLPASPQLIQIKAGRPRCTHHAPIEYLR